MSAQSKLRVVQLNVGSLLEPEWDVRRHEIVAWLDDLAPDIACFQETWEQPDRTNTGRWIAEQSTIDWRVEFGGAPFGPDLWPDDSLKFGSTILSRWPIDHSSYHQLPVAHDDAWVESVPWELLHVRTAGLDVFSTHLAAAPTHGRHRRQQVVAIDQLVRTVRGDLDDVPPPGTKRDAMPAILCGDFNAEPDSDEIRFLRGYTPIDGRTTFWQDAWSVAGADGPGHTQSWRTNPIAASMNIQPKRIDYVFVGDPYQRTGSAGRVLDARLAFHERRTGVIASDHFGLIANIVWPDRPDV